VSEPPLDYASAVATGKGDDGTTGLLFGGARVRKDDLVALCEGIRTASASVLSSAELAAANEALDEAIEVYRWTRRLAGDARKKNAFLQFLYKGG